MKTTNLFTAILAMALLSQLPAQSQVGSASGLAKLEKSDMKPFGHNEGQSKEFKYKVPGSPEQYTLKVSNLQTDITFEAYSGTELVITALDYEGIPEKAKGLKPLSATGPDNTEIGLNIKTEGNVILLSGAGKAASDSDYMIKMPTAMGLSFEQESWHGGGDFTVKGLSGEINVQSKNSDIILTDVSGPVVANSVSGDINIVFSKLNATKPTSVAATSGDVDITMPSEAKVNFKLSVVSGEIYTDLDLKFAEKEGLKSWGGMNANPTFNGGGVEIALRAVSGDIFLREK